MTRDEVLKMRDQIYISLLVREGKTLDASCAMERASNIAQWLEAEIDDLVKAALIEAPRGCVVTGSITTDEGK